MILDQFEEYFLYKTAGDEPETFAYQFAQAANRHGSPASFLVSLREDSVSKLDRFKRLIPDLFANYMRVERLTAQQAKEAIEEPIKRYNELDAEDRLYAGEVSIETELVDEVVSQVRAGSVQLGSGGRGVAGGDDDAGIEAPYLQLVMTYLWDREMEAGSPRPRLRLETLTDLEKDDVRGADQIVKTHLDRVIQQIPSQDHPMCSKVFQFLVTPSGTKIALSATDLAKNADVTVDRLEPALERLSGSETRILAPVAAPSGSQAPKLYQIYHDSLAQAILDWRGRFEEAARRRATTRRLLLAAAVVLVAVGVAAFSWYLKSEADAARAEAERLQQVADAATSEAKAERESSKAAALEAEAALAEAQNNKELADQLRAQADDATRRSEQFQGEAEQQRQIAEKQTTSLGDRLAEAERRAAEAEKENEQLAADNERVRIALAEAGQTAKANGSVLRDLRAIQAGLVLGAADQEAPLDVERRLHQLAGPEGVIPHEGANDSTRIAFGPTGDSLVRTDLSQLTLTWISSTYPITPGVVSKSPTRFGKSEPTAIQYDPMGDVLVVGYSDGRVAIRPDVHSLGSELTALGRHNNKSALTSVASSSSRSSLVLVASAAKDALFVVAGTPASGFGSHFETSTKAVDELQWHPDLPLLAGITPSTLEVVAWDLDSQDARSVLDDQYGTYATAFGPDGLLATFSWEHGARLYSTDGWDRLEWVDDGALSIAFHPTKHRFAVWHGNYLAVHDSKNGNGLFRFGVSLDAIGGWHFSPVVFSPDGKRLAIPGQTGTLIYSMDPKRLAEIASIRNCRKFSALSQGCPDVPATTAVAK